MCGPRRPPRLGTSHLLPGGGWGRLHFHVMYKQFYDPTPQSRWKIISTPPPIYDKNVYDPHPPHPNSQYSSPQTQSFILLLYCYHLSEDCLPSLSCFCASFYENQNCLLMTRQNDNHSPGPGPGRQVPSSHERSELSNTILSTSSRGDKRVWKCIPIPNGLGGNLHL